MKLKDVVYALIFLVVGFLVYRRISASDNTAARGNGNSNKAMNVNAYIVKPGSISEKIIITGTIQANEEVDIRPESSGIITGIHFQEGKNVTKGALLLKINDSELQARDRKSTRLNSSH